MCNVWLYYSFIQRNWSDIHDPSEMQFQKYHHINNIGDVERDGDEEWIAMEKIHGSNLQFVVTEKTVITGKRNSLLREDDMFGNYQGVRRELTSELFSLRRLIGKDIIVYGELFGGRFIDVPGYPVQKDSICIQKEILYCPNNKFYAFDILTDDGFMNYDDMVDYCEKIDIPYCKALYRGSFAEMKALNPVFESTYPSIFGLPSPSKNFAEGYVVKPVINKENSRGQRIIYKHKAPRFTERLSFRTNIALAKKEAPTEQCVVLTSEIAQLICTNRLMNVLSKLTSTNQPVDIVRRIYTGKLVADAIEEHCRERNLHLSLKEKKYIAASLQQPAKVVVDRYLAGEKTNTLCYTPSFAEGT